ncbi:MAG: hypothetical protein IPN43_13795 [Chitinophagaceae bacterium]|nr:hypothetical protein [Chitinophagaceae bacterium]
MTAKTSYLFLLLSCLKVIDTHGQISIKNLKLSNVDTNLLYIGVTNTLKVVGVSQSQAKLSSQFSSIERNNNNEFNVRAYRIGTDTFTVSQNGKVAFTKVFEVSRISDPKICLTKHCAPHATINEIILDPTLYFVVPNCLYVHNITVWNFSGVFLKENGDIIKTFDSQTNKFTNDQVQIIASLKKGDKIYFDKGIIGSPDSMPRTFASFSITIK